MGKMRGLGSQSVTGEPLKSGESRLLEITAEKVPGWRRLLILALSLNER